MFEGDPGLWIGTSSWTERDWIGTFYPRGLASRDYISHYAQFYDTVEVDSTFYAMPTDGTVEGWRDRTPSGFIFSAKVPRVITHDKRLLDARADMETFVDIMTGLGDRLGPMLLQFPFFSRQAFRTAQEFFERLDAFLDELPQGFRYVVEVRNPGWIGPELAQLCRRRGVALAWTERPRMPSAEEWPERLGESEFVEGDAVTDEADAAAGFVYLRFLGDHHADITKRRDCSADIARWLPVIRNLRRARVDVYGYVNNHFAGHAPATIEEFRVALGGTKLPIRQPQPPVQGELF